MISWIRSLFRRPKPLTPEQERFAAITREALMVLENELNFTAAWSNAAYLDDLKAGGSRTINIRKPVRYVK